METVAADSFNDDLPDPEVCSCEEALALRERVAELEDLGYAGALKLATAYADLNAVEGRLREAVGLLERWMADEDHAEDGSVRSETGSLLASAQPAAPAPRVGCPCGRCDTCWRNAGCPETPPPWGGEP